MTHKKAPTVNELFIISNTIKDNSNGVPLSDIEVIFRVDKKLIDKINEDFFYRNNPNAEKNEFKSADEVEVIVNQIKFKYTTY